MAKSNNSFRVCVVFGSVLFVMYWTGILQAIARMLLALILLPFSSFRIQYVGDAQQHTAESLADVDPLMDEIDQAMRRSEEKVESHIMDVVNLMEDMVASNEMDYMTDVEMEETFANLYDMFPLMDKLFDMALKEESLSSINPRYDYHSIHRRYEAMRRALEKRRAERLVSNAESQLGEEDDEAIIEDEL